MDEELTEKQAVFVREYLKDHNGKQAYIRAGYKSAKPEIQACKLLKKPKVAAAVAAAQDARAVRTLVEADEVILELKAIGFADLGAEDTPPKDGDPPRKAKEVPRYDHKLKALELLGKHLRLFTDRQEQVGDGGGPLVVEIHKYDERDD